MEKTMQKSLYNLLCVTTATPISVSSAGTTVQWGTPVIYNPTAKDGIIYYHAGGFASVTAGYKPTLYHSWNNQYFIKCTALPAITTAGAKAVYINGLGSYLRLGYLANGSRVISNVRAMLELFEETFR
jgi:hypothetical protein